MRVNDGGYFFNIDLANSGDNFSHKKLFKNILDNIADYVDSFNNS